MKYEIFLWLTPNLAADQVKKEIKIVEDYSLEAGLPAQAGKSTLRSSGKQKLAYKIKGFEEGLAVSGQIELSPDKISEIKTGFDRNANVLRYLVLV